MMKYLLDFHLLKFLALLTVIKAGVSSFKYLFLIILLIYDKYKNTPTLYSMDVLSLIKMNLY